MGKIIKPIVLALVGPSGCGKTTLSMMLHEHCGIPFIVSTTTRAMRSGEKEGVDYFYVSEETFNQQKETQKMVSWTRYGEFQYCSYEYQFESVISCSYVIDEDGLVPFMKEYGDKYVIVPIYISCPESIRKERGATDERIARDTKRLVLPESTWDIVFENDGSEECLKEFAIGLKSYVASLYEAVNRQ